MELFRVLCILCSITGAGTLFGQSTVGDLRVVVVAGERYYSIRDIASIYNLSIRVPPGRSMHLQGRSGDLDFEADSRRVRVNGTLVWLHKPILRNKGRWLISEADTRKTIDPLMRQADNLVQQPAAVVVLDPGHGGKDKGAVGHRNVEEKRVVLDVARRTRRHLVNAGLKVHMTRETDRFIPLTDRTARAAQWGADIFVSIHLNSAVSRSANGIETYVIAAPGCSSTAAQNPSNSDQVAHAGNLYDEANIILGYYLQKAMVQNTKAEDRGVRRARFMVLKNAPCPAALVECGFVSNRAEEELMLKAEYREALALAISQGILDYVKAASHAKLSRRR